MAQKTTTVTLKVDLTQFNEAIRKATLALQNFGRALTSSPKRDRHHPRPLTIDGHAYARRRKSRQRRNHR